MLTKAEITLVRSLADKKGRREHGLFVVEGRKMVTEALASGYAVRQVYGTAEELDALGIGPKEGGPAVRVKDKTNNVPGGVSPGGPTGSVTGNGTARGAVAITEVSPSQFERLSRLKAPQGVLALVELPRPGVHSVSSGLVIALDRVQDPGNLGTIVRVADWFGVRQMVCSPDCADVYNPKAIQATMGSLFRVAVGYTPLEEYLARASIPVFGAFMDGDSVYGCGPVTDGILVMGNEGSGIGPALSRLITRRVSVPPFPADAAGAESLNVAVATAVIVSHFRGGAGR